MECQDKIDWDYLQKRSTELQCDDIILKSKQWAEKELVRINIEKRIGQLLSFDGKVNRANIFDEYKKQAKEIINNAGGKWPGEAADIKIAQSLLLERFDKFKIDRCLTQESPGSVGISKDHANQYAQNIIKQSLTPEFQKKLRETSKSKGLDR